MKEWKKALLLSKVMFYFVYESMGFGEPESRLRSLWDFFVAIATSLNMHREPFWWFSSLSR